MDQKIHPGMSQNMEQRLSGGDSEPPQLDQRAEAMKSRPKWVFLRKGELGIDRGQQKKGGGLKCIHYVYY